MKFSRIAPIIFLITICSLNTYSYGRYFMKPSDSVMRTPPKTHTILLSVTSGGTLTLKDPAGNRADTIEVEYDDEIVWTSSDPAITILDIKEKSTTGHFKQKPTAANKWHGKVKNWSNRRPRKAIYSIIWKDSSGNTDTYDPLIKINPNQIN